MSDQNLCALWESHTGTRTARVSVHSAHAQEIYMSPVARVGEIVLMLRFQKK